MIRAYLDYAGLGRLRERARLAMQTTLNEVLPDGSAKFATLSPVRTAARSTAARLLDCTPEEVALVPNTSTGVHLVADGLDWELGAEVVVFDGDFPANVRPWLALQSRGVRVRWVPMVDGGYCLDDLATAISSATRLIAVSHVNFATGFRIDLDAVCAHAADVGALVFVDAIQSLGALPLSVSRTPVDFVAAGGHKWLCGPAGTGIFYCRAGRLGLLRRVPSGWFGYQGASDMLNLGLGHLRYDLPLLPSTERVEGGMDDLLAIVGLAAAAGELVEVGIESVSDRIRQLTQAVRTGLVGLGCTLLPSHNERSWSGIVSFTHPRHESGRIVDELVASGVHVSHPNGLVRVSPHYWTAEDEISVLLDAVARVCS